MKYGINISIDVTKLNQKRFYEGKNGAKYADMTVFVDPDNPDKYGQHGGVYEQQSQEERQNKESKNFVGNVKVFWQGDSNGGYTPEQQNDDSSDIPF